MKPKLSFKYIKQQLKYVDRVYWVIFALLIAVAVLALFSASSTLAFAGENTLSPIFDQAIFLVGGILLAFVIQFIPSHYIRWAGYIGLGLSILFLLLTYTGLGVRINGATRWLNIGGIVFQPSELAKITLIIVVSDLLSRIKKDEDHKFYFKRVMIITGVVCVLILFNNLSTTLLLGGIVFILFFLARVKIKYWGTVLLIAIGSLFIGYLFVKHVYVVPGKQIESKILGRAVTWVNRVDNMIDEWNAPAEQKFSLEDDYQRTLAKVAIAHGGATPLGVLPGNSTERDFLPQAFADYIFAIIVEESGLIGAALLMMLYLAILFRSCIISSRYSDYSAMLMVMGLALMLTCQALLSMMVSVGIGPVTGQPLPLISRGGTSVLVTCLYFGIIMCVAREQKELRERRQINISEGEKNVPKINLDDFNDSTSLSSTTEESDMQPLVVNAEHTSNEDVPTITFDD
ncbi:MAG: FtsW/RodA/SpoVE family cell cycle protein [Paludibacteraceae bacterium]|nr:FtsW/RodA/SpoVE family cell cycle protein [Paludibacteraceae bacterium]